jgi:ribosomal-protein-alanine N-acetyltransferase
MANHLITNRLILRRWRADDRLPFRKMNSDPRVMEYMPGLLSAADSDALVDRIESHFDRHGFGLFAMELLESKSFIGFTGLMIPAFDAPFMPAVEIGWRLAAEYWGKGLATEAAQEVLRYAFDYLQLKRVVSFTVPHNTRSRRVMEKIGMQHSPGEDFDHPSLPVGHPLRRHVLYKVERS